MRVAELPSPPLGPGEIRIATVSAGVNRADLLQRRGLYPPPPGASPVLGLEAAGRVAEVAPDVTGLVMGEPVMALLAGGGYASEAVVPAGCVMKVPPALDLVDAGGFPEVHLTAFLNLFLLGHLEPGETALVHGGSGGVGTAAIQLAREAGCRVLVTAGSPERCRRCLDLGADAAFDHRTEDWVERCLAATDGAGVAVVLDCIGAPYLERHLKVLAVGGRLLVIGLQGGAKGELDLAALMRRRLTLIGSTLRARPAAEKATVIERFLARFGEAMHAGRLRPVIDRVVPLARVADAHRALESGEVFGKVVLDMAS